MEHKSRKEFEEKKDKNKIAGFVILGKGRFCTNLLYQNKIVTWLFCFQDIEGKFCKIVA